MAFRPFKVGIVGSAMILSTFAMQTSALAQTSGREAQIVVDAQTNEILYEYNAQAPRIPASITKVMTLYLLFDALEKGTITWDDRINFSRNAANQPPTKLFVGAGNSIGVQTAVEALILRSANDVATAVAERLGGSESNFAQMMTRKARELGMSSTTFRNASGLPNAGQRTTAEDLARLAIAIHRDFPEQYHWFSAQQMSYNGQIISGHNHLLGRMSGMDGLKTGYTNASKFNLAATTQRNGRRIVTVVLGGANRFQRDDLVEALTESAFRELGIGAPQFAMNATSYDVNFRDARDAADAAALFMDLPPRPVTTGGVTTIAMARSGRRLGFTPGAPTFQVADMTRPPMARTANTRNSPLNDREDESNSATDEGEDDAVRAVPAPVRQPTPVPVPFRVAVAPSAVPVPVPVPVRAPTPRPAPVAVPVPFPSTASASLEPRAANTPPRPVTVPVPMVTPTRQEPVVTPLRQMAELETTPPAAAPPPPAQPILRGTLETPAPSNTDAKPEAMPTQMAEAIVQSPVPEASPTNLPTPVIAPVAAPIPVQVAETTPPQPAEQSVAAVAAAEVAPVAQPSTAPAETVVVPATQMAELAAQDAANLATPKPPASENGELNGSINLAEATPTATTASSEAAPVSQPTVQMAALDPEAVAQAQRRQAEATAREQARLAEAQEIENARKEAARLQAVAAARALAERQANERRIERQQAEARAKAQKEKEARELALAAAEAERKAVQERAIAAREEERRQAEAARARNTRGNAVVQVGAFKDKADANAAITQFARFFPSFAQREVSTVTRRDGIWYRARFMGLAVSAASEACRAVSGRGGVCAVVGD